jgi:RNA polymerase sigma-70 factor (ECF subfamily)
MSEPGASPSAGESGPAGGGVRVQFEALALPHLARLYRLAVRLTGKAADAEDLVHETYMKGLHAFGTLRDPERIRPWLSRILARLVLDRRREHGREVAVGDLAELDRFVLYDRILDEDPFPYSDRLHEDFLEHFETDDVREALRALPDVYRVPLVLLYTEELTYAELADVLGCPVGTVMSRLHRGRKLLERGLWEFARRRGLIRTWKP